MRLQALELRCACVYQPLQVISTALLATRLTKSSDVASTKHQQVTIAHPDLRIAIGEIPEGLRAAGAPFMIPSRDL